MDIRIIVRQCMDCKKVLGIIPDGPILISQEDVDNLSAGVMSNISANVDMMGVSHGLCPSCMDIRATDHEGGEA